jgi:ABC-type Co2+ transport system permease subunit
MSPALVIGAVFGTRLVTVTTGIIAVVLEHLSTALVAPAIALYFGAIAFLLGWVLLVGRSLVTLGTVRDLAGPEGGSAAAR